MIAFGQVFWINQGFRGSEDEKELDAVTAKGFDEAQGLLNIFLCVSLSTLHIGIIMPERIAGDIVRIKFEKQLLMKAFYDIVIVDFAKTGVNRLVIGSDKEFAEAEIFTNILLTLALIVARGNAFDSEVGLHSDAGETVERCQREGMPSSLNEDCDKKGNRQ